MMNRSVSGFLIVLVIAAELASAAEPLDFNRDIRPILSNHCWSCHGPDESTRESGLRLDRRDAVLAKLPSGRTAVVPGEPAASELLARIDSTDPDREMPPASAKRPLTPRQRQLLRDWIEQGAAFAEHWGFTPPRRPELPAVADVSWPRTAVDRFVLSRLEREGLGPSPPAKPEQWLRRVTLDLTGLPPTVEELDAFVKDQAPDARERVIERLLISPRFAERMAMQWLDLARYADTNGYNNDETRTMWPWRDWVIGAFARGLPYDQFLTEQLAGDLLPNATLDQRVATGFCRNHVLTTEGGIIEEEYHIEYVADRVHTVSTVFLGLSLQCARCHDHKYDPFTQRDYYRMAGFFNNVPDKVVSYSKGRMAEPLLKVPSAEQQQALTRLAARKQELEARAAELAAHADRAVANWEAGLSEAEKRQLANVSLVAAFAFEEMGADLPADGVDPSRTTTLSGTLTKETGRIGQALRFDGKTHFAAGQIGDFDAGDAWTLAAWIHVASNDPVTVMSKIDESNAFRGYDLIIEGGRVASHFVHQWPERGFKVIAKEPLSLNAWHHVAVTYDGSRRSSGARIYVDGRPQEFTATTDNLLDGTLKTDKPFHIGKRFNSAPFQGLLDEVQLFGRPLAAEEVQRLAAGQFPIQLADVLAVPFAERTDAQRNRVRQYYLEQVDPAYRQVQKELRAMPDQLAQVEQEIPVTMVMEEMQPPRKSFVLRRGQYDQRGEEVERGVAEVLAPWPDGAPRDRLGFARWLASDSHPLTARVAVNRWWEMLFGTGLVETVEDFGVQGAGPTHPELLDWLATELVRHDWDLRHILKQLVLSATYGQASRITPDLWERDSRNRLLARGPRLRLSAETLRDSALAVGGLLCEQIGGPSVKPYQPAGLWEDVSVERRDKYVPESGANLYRRSMYTFWKRTCPPPTLTTFDAPDRETCVVRRARTNTPLQALILLNDPTYVEAARQLATRLLSAAGSDTERFQLAYQTVVSRRPDAEEVATLVAVLAEARARYRADHAAAEALTSVGESKRDERIDVRELAAWTTLACLLLNLDEAVVKY